MKFGAIKLYAISCFFSSAFFDGIFPSSMIGDNRCTDTNGGNCLPPLYERTGTLLVQDLLNLGGHLIQTRIDGNVVCHDLIMYLIQDNLNLSSFFMQRHLKIALGDL